MNDIKSEALHGIKWSVVNSVGGKVIGFLIGVVLARLLSPSDFGTVGMVAIFFSLAAIIVDSGFSSALIRKPDVTEKDTSTVFYFNIVISFIVLLLLFALSGTVASYLNAPVLSDIIKLTALSIFIGSFGSVQFALLKKDVNFRTPALITLTAQLVSGIIGVVLAYKGYGPWALVWQAFMSTTIKTIVVWFVSKWRPKLIFSWNSFKNLFAFGGNLAINSLLDVFFQDGIGLIIGKFYTPSQLGLYTRGQGTAQLPSSFLYNAVGSVTFPVLSKIQNDEKRLLEVYRSFMKTFSMVVFFVMILLIAVAKPLTVFLFSEKWIDSVIYLQLFSVVYMFYHVHALNFNFLMVKGRSDWALKKELINKGVKFILLLTLIKYGVVYVCIAFCLSSIFDIFVNTTVTGYLFKYGFKEQFKDFIPYLLISIMCCLPSFVITYIFEVPFVSLVLGGFVAISLYIGYFLLTKDEVFYKLVQLTPFKNRIDRFYGR
jgi:O-antigen/teichoic acid export membrane protein